MHLAVDDIVAGYGRIEVLHGISFSVPASGRVGLFGPNGHGKTTLLRAITGLVPQQSGKVTFGDTDLSGASSKRVIESGIVHVPQGSTLFPRMSVQEALTLGAYTKRAWPRRKESLDKVLTIFPRLAERRSQRCNTLSGGERQMAAIGIGLMGCPQLLILDEPTLGLAPRIRAELAKSIHAVARTGVSLVAVDQDVDLLLGLCEKLYLIEQGRVALEVSDRSQLQHQDILRRYFGNAV
jgi:branched-chain amino acid transport system ATP-binding protein